MVVCLNEYKNLEILKEEVYNFKQFKSLNECNSKSKRLGIYFTEKEQTYSFKEFASLNNYDMNEWNRLNPMNKDFDINRVDYWLGRLKSDPDLYKKAIAYLAVGLQVLSLCATPCFAEAQIPGLGQAFDSILNLLFEIAQYSFLALGIKDAVIKILNGGSVKDAIQASLQYAFGFLFLKLYPTIYKTFSCINLK